MKLGQALQEKFYLEYRLDVLGSRLRDVQGSRDVQDTLSKEIISASNRLRDLEVAISWTEQMARVDDLPLTAYRIRASANSRLAKMHEGINNQTADNFYDLADTDNRLLEKTTWLMDLQIPVFSSDDEPKEGED